MWLNSSSSAHPSPNIRLITRGPSSKPLIVVVGLSGVGDPHLESSVCVTLPGVVGGAQRKKQRYSKHWEIPRVTFQEPGMKASRILCSTQSHNPQDTVFTAARLPVSLINFLRAGIMLPCSSLSLQ